MLIDNFCKEMAARFPYSLKTTEQINAYYEDAQFILKNYQGEILGFAFNIIREDWTKLPKIPDVKHICLKVKIPDTTEKEKKEAALSYEEAKQMVDQFMRSARGQECIRRKIANQAKDFIWENIKLPDDKDCNHFLKVEEETGVLLESMKRSDGKGPLAGLSKSVLGIGMHFRVKEKELRDKYFKIIEQS